MGRKGDNYGAAPAVECRIDLVHTMSISTEEGHEAYH